MNRNRQCPECTARRAAGLRGRRGSADYVSSGYARDVTPVGLSKAGRMTRTSFLSSRSTMKSSPDCSVSQCCVGFVKPRRGEELRTTAEADPEEAGPSTAGSGSGRVSCTSAAAMGHSILIIDDDPTTRFVLSRVLERDGYRTVTADNGAQGVRRLVEAKPCVIVLDDEMPIMDGHDFREVQKRIAPDVPIVCMTAHSDPELVARRVGAVRVHPKPLDLPGVRTTVREICDGSHGACHAVEPVGAVVAR